MSAATGADTQGTRITAGTRNVTIEGIEEIGKRRSTASAFRYRVEEFLAKSLGGRAEAWGQAPAWV